ncbi:hypothetical protein [Desulfosarcina variabilis]|uniref:hypothetical protein n=1 Tax=Desulfosarcina variabilis TaxID=2300 RepID=UPI003AFA2F3D
MKHTIKHLILEFVSENGSGHIKEIHLQITQIRPEVPQHTIRARLSEMSRTRNLEEKIRTYGDGFYGIYSEIENLNSVVSYPDRGPWGDSSYRGNCSGYLVKDLILRFKCQSVFDPAEGSGTIKEVVAGINRFRQRNIFYEGRDLKSGFDITSDPMPNKQFDMVWFHPPYWDIIKYSSNPCDLSACQTLAEFEDKLNSSVEKLIGVIKPYGIIAILIGDKRKDGNYYPLFRTLLSNPNIGQLKSIIIKIQHNCHSERINYKNKNPFLIPIKHEYCLIYQKSENC